LNLVVRPIIYFHLLFSRNPLKSTNIGAGPSECETKLTLFSGPSLNMKLTGFEPMAASQGYT